MEVGEIIAGKYRVERQIGAGGMGTVVAATHLQLGTQVALKFLSDKIKDSHNSIERFTREAKACAALRSEHICRVSDFGMHAEMPYIAMELLEGIDLAQLIRSGAIESGMAVELILQACDGLAEAHSHGIVHRDLKPGNLFLTRRPDGTPLIKVLDFGVAKIPQSEDTSLTKTSSVIGSPGYMAPEQLRSSKTVDARADLWALGVILYELVSKRHPFHAEAVTEIAVKIAMDDPEPLLEVTGPLRSVIMRCLEKEPEQRFPDIASLAASLAPLRPQDRGAALAFATRRIENPRPTMLGSSAPAVYAVPPGKTNEVGSRAVPIKRSRVALFAVAGILVVGGLTAFALTRGGDPAPLDAPAPLAIPRPAVASAPPPLVDAAASAPVVVDAVATAPVVVDAVATAPVVVDAVATAPVVVVATAPIVGDAAPPVVADVRPGRPKPPERPKPTKPIAAKPEPVTVKLPTVVAQPPEPPVDPKVDAERLVVKATATMRTRGLTFEDLGGPAVELRDDISRDRRAADWPAMREAAQKLSALALAFVLDDGFIATKSGRLTAQLGASRPTDELRTRILELQTAADGSARRGNYAGANMTLNRAFTLMPPMPTAPLPPVSRPPPDPY